MGTQQVSASLSQWRARAVSLHAAVSMLVSFSAAARTQMRDVLLVGIQRARRRHSPDRHFQPAGR